jgi:ribA/ribD-fused uncharacterized protein
MINRFVGKYAFLSNLYYCDIHFGGLVYPSAEHAFQAAKALPGHRDREIIRRAGSPLDAKKLGRSIGLRADWETVKIDMMNIVLEDKFTRHSVLREALIATGEEELIEGNTWNDTFWGVCNGKGLNHLGKCLMSLRERLNHGLLWRD